MATIWKRKDRDVWVADYRDATGKRIRHTAATREEAELLLAEKVKEVAKEKQQGGSSTPPYWDYTLAEYVPVFLDRARDELEEKTWRSYKQNLDHHVAPVLGNVLVREMLAPNVGTKLTLPSSRNQKWLRNLVGRVGVEPTAR